MPLALNDFVRVRIAISIQDNFVDMSVGQVYDEGTSSWTDIVWVAISSGWVTLREFGDVEFWCRVNSLALTRSSVTRPSVYPVSWCTGGTEADTYVYQTTAYSSFVSWARLQAGGSDIYTNLPGLGSILNTVGIEGYQYARAGFSGRIRNPVRWSTSRAGTITKLTSYRCGDSSKREFTSHISGSSDSLAGFSAWLAANKPELGSPITLHIVGTKLNVTSTGQTLDAVSATISILINADNGTGIGWTATGTNCGLSVTDRAVTVCGGGTEQLGGFGVGNVYVPSSPTPPAPTVSLGVALTAASGSFARVAAGGGTLTVTPSPADYKGLSVTFTVDSEGRIAACGATMAGYTLQGWGVCREEGGLLA